MLSHIPLSDNATVQSSRVLYTAGEFAKKNLIYLQEAGTLTALRSHKSTRERLDSYLFFCVLSGNGRLNYDGKTYYLKAGDCVFLDCRLPYSHETDDDSLWQLVWIHFYGASASAIYEEYKKNGGKTVFNTSSAEYYLETQKRIAEESGKEAICRDTVIFGLLSGLISNIVSEGSSQTTKSSSKQLPLSVKDYLEARFAEKIALDDLANEFHINKFYLTRVFKAHFGQSISEYLMQRRITAAKSMLRFTDNTAENIALNCGINDAGYFCRLFKRLEGETPSEYRSRWNTANAQQIPENK